MRLQQTKPAIFAAVGAVLAMLLAAPSAMATIQGITGPTFNLVAGEDYLSLPDGTSIYIWGFGDQTTGQVQYPGPTLIVNQGATVTINLTNNLTEPVSMIFPGQSGVTNATPVVAGGTVRSFAKEAAPNGGTVTYSFVASRAGTYVYESGTDIAKQVYLGLFGTLIVRPTGYLEDPAAHSGMTLFNDGAALTRHAYGVCDAADNCDALGESSKYQREYLFVQSEIDPRINRAVEQGNDPAPYIADFHPTGWLYNGRSFPDTILVDQTPLLPAQPYGSIAMAHPGERVLVRLVTMGRDPHPFHTHGNHQYLIAHDGVPFQSNPAGASAADRGHEVFTQTGWPGQTWDGIWHWTGADTGWDIYGDPNTVDYAHTCVDSDCTDANSDGFDDVSGAACYDDRTFEYCPDHGLPFPTAMPDANVLAYGAFFSGSPFMGASVVLPPGQGGFNAYSGMFFMWHSHTEGELSTVDIFPGGMITMMGMLPLTAPISY